MIEVVNRRTAPPLREGELRFAIGRSSSGLGPGEVALHALANPYSFKEGTTAQYRVTTREETIERYGAWLLAKVAQKDQAICGALNTIYRAAKAGRKVSLACFCAPKACHGHVVAELVEEKLAGRG